MFVYTHTESGFILNSRLWHAHKHIHTRRASCMNAFMHVRSMHARPRETCKEGGQHIHIPYAHVFARRFVCVCSNFALCVPAHALYIHDAINLNLILCHTSFMDTSTRTYTYTSARPGQAQALRTKPAERNVCQDGWHGWSRGLSMNVYVCVCMCELGTTFGMNACTFLGMYTCPGYVRACVSQRFDAHSNWLDITERPALYGHVLVPVWQCPSLSREQSRGSDVAVSVLVDYGNVRSWLLENDQQYLIEHSLL